MKTFKVLVRKANGTKHIRELTVTGRVNPHLTVLHDERIHGPLPTTLLPVTVRDRRASSKRSYWMLPAGVALFTILHFLFRALGL